MQYTGPSHDVGELRFIRADLDEGVLTVTLDRPGQRNMMNVGMTLEMETLLEAVRVDMDIRVIVLRGAGSGFCAGLDIADFYDTTQHSEMALRAARESANNWRVRLLRLLPQPVIALVHGFCEGGAIAVLEACDIVIADHNARFTINDASGRALFGGPSAKAVSTVMLPRAASYYALTGESFDGREAEINGLATLSLPSIELEAETYSLARDLVAKEALALRFTKETLLHAPDMTWDGVLNFTAAKFGELKMLQMGQPSARAGAIDSFLSGKSKPGLGR